MSHDNINDSVSPPNQEPTGTTQLPFSRVKRIITSDHDIQIMSNAGAFIITLATEMFIQHLAKQAYSVLKSERKPRRTIQYRDLAMAVSNHDNLEFLVDVVPTTMTYKQFKEKQSSSRLRNTNGDTSVNEEGQTTLSNPKAISNGHSTSDGVGEECNEGKVDFNEQLRLESNIQKDPIILKTPEVPGSPKNFTKDIEMI